MTVLKLLPEGSEAIRLRYVVSGNESATGEPLYEASRKIRRALRGRQLKHLGRDLRPGLVSDDRGKMLEGFRFEGLFAEYRWGPAILTYGFFEHHSEWHPGFELEAESFKTKPRGERVDTVAKEFVADMTREGIFLPSRLVYGPTFFPERG